jgi:mono/diheme cytochrome c family protein
MRLRIAFGIVAAVWTVGVTQLSVSALQTTGARTVWDGVFTEDQAKRGLEQYKTACSECHGGDLVGDGFAPALTGSEFAGNWNELSVGDLFERVRISMPPTDPSSVTPAQKADILAYVMHYNKYPAGKTELEPKTEALKLIKIQMKK